MEIECGWILLNVQDGVFFVSETGAILLRNMFMALLKFEIVPSYLIDKLCSSIWRILNGVAELIVFREQTNLYGFFKTFIKPDS